MFYIDACSTAGAVNIMQVKEMTLFNGDIFFTILQYGVALVTNCVPRCFLVVIIFNNFHILYCITNIVPKSRITR